MNSTSVPGFLTKTFEIFSSPEYNECCGWGANGDTIVIRKIEQFSKEVLPKYFKHSNFQSFVRQLNMYDFHKTVQDPNHGEFQHQYFKRDHPDLLIKIKRKANKTLETFKKYQKGNNESTQNFDQLSLPNNNGQFNMLSDIVSSNLLVNKKLSQNSLQNGRMGYNNNKKVHNNPQEYHTTFIDHEQESSMILKNPEDFESRMENKLIQIQEENQMLKKLCVETHNSNIAMRNVLQGVIGTFYSVFKGTNGNNNGSLMQKSPSLLITDLQFIQNQLQSLQNVPQLKPLLAIDENHSGSNFTGDVNNFRNIPTGEILEYQLAGTNMKLTRSFSSNIGDNLDLDSFPLERIPSIDISTEPVSPLLTTMESNGDLESSPSSNSYPKRSNRKKIKSEPTDLTKNTQNKKSKKVQDNYGYAGMELASVGKGTLNSFEMMASIINDAEQQKYSDVNLIQPVLSYEPFSDGNEAQNEFSTAREGNGITNEHGNGKEGRKDDVLNLSEDPSKEIMNELGNALLQRKSEPGLRRQDTLDIILEVLEDERKDDH